MLSILGTAPLLHIKLYDDVDKCLFVMADDIYFSTHRLYDLAISRGIEIPVLSMDDILAHKIPYEINRPLALFKEYLQNGFYPFFAAPGYYIRLKSVINQTLENDIPEFAQMSISTTQKLKKLLYIIAQSVPFKPNFSKLSRDLDVSRSDVPNLMVYLEKAGIINQLRADTKGLKLLGKVEKVFLSNTNLAYAISDVVLEIGTIRERVFFAQMSTTQAVTSSVVSDFCISKYTFEVGGRGKKQKQIDGIHNAYIVKDDIEYGVNNVLPLWVFGLTY